jgi:branched-subunit amino acid aminotransferase/4-amino-4-deoxychorismate lyase
VATLSYGHFTAMAVDGLRVRGLPLHLNRLVRDCAAVFGATLDPDHVRSLLHRVARRCDGPTILRVTVFDPAASVARPGLSDGHTRPSVLITTRAVAPPGRSGGLRVRTVGYVRDLPTVKHVGIFGSLHQRRRAQQAGFDDALFLTGGPTGNNPPTGEPGPSPLLCEGPTWNVAVVLGEELIWPDDRCLPGITRDLLRSVNSQIGVESRDRSVSRAELADARGAFATSAGIGVVAITQVDGVVLPDASGLLEKLRAGYARIPGERL